MNGLVKLLGDDHAPFPFCRMSFPSNCPKLTRYGRLPSRDSHAESADAHVVSP